MSTIKSYGKSELAMMYFPHAETKRGALNNLNNWIRGNSDLNKSLQQCGMPQKSKFFTPKEVSLIFHFLGEP